MTILNVLGGLAIFIFGMQMMSNGLHQVAGERMRTILRLFSANRFVAVLSGAAVTTVIQSSSASTVMVIGFVNAGLLTLCQAMGIIFGANIGTTVTAQLVAFDIAWIIMPSIILGLLLSFIPNRTFSNWSSTVIGLGFLFLGMQLMSGQLKNLAKHPAFMEAFQTFKCAPVDGVMPPMALLGAICVGIIATLIIQSSSACTGIVIALGASGLVDLYTGVALALGANVGTTITAQLAALAANRVAKQAALAHTLFNVLGVLIICGTFWITWDKEPVFFRLVEWLSADGSLPRKIANAHTVFNCATTFLLMPFIPLLAKTCEKIIPLQKKEVKYEYLEPHLLETPSIALAQTVAALRKMLKKAWKMIDTTLRIYNKNDEKNQKRLKQMEKREADIDERQQKITEYLSELMLQRLTPEEAGQIPLLLHCTNDTERIGDHASILKDVVERMRASEHSLSQEAECEFNRLHKNLNELSGMTVDILEKHSRDTMQDARTLENEINKQLVQAEEGHMNRLNKGQCTPEAGILYLELIEEIRKVTRHLTNILDRADMLYERLPKAK